MIENQLYEGWLYALVVNTNDTINGLYVTKDAGLNWTKVAIPTSTTVEGGVPGTPSNNAADTAVNIVGNYSGRSASNTPRGTRPGDDDGPDQSQHRLHRGRGS